MLARFLAALATRESPVLLDLGPVVGSNVSFLGEQLGCKLRVEDVFADLDRLTREGKLDTLPEYFAQRFAYPSESLDAILCWDVFDYLEKPAAQALAKIIVDRLKPGGVLLALFSVSANLSPTYTRYVIVDAAHVRHRTYPAVHPRRTVYHNRDVDRLFDGLSVTESFLLLSKTREMLLRKKTPAPPEPAAAATPATSAPAPARAAKTPPKKA